MKHLRNPFLYCSVIWCLAFYPSLDQTSLYTKLSTAVNYSAGYGIFDYVNFSINGSIITVWGYTVDPKTKDDIKARVKTINGVTGINDLIQILPVSPSDVQTREIVRRKFSEAGLSKYMSDIDPDIHLVIKNGHLTLYGVVSTVEDKNLATVIGNQVSVVFSVQNFLRIRVRS